MPSRVGGAGKKEADTDSGAPRKHFFSPRKHSGKHFPAVPEDCLFSIYTLTSTMLPGEALLFSEGREALLPGGTTLAADPVFMVGQAKASRV